MYQFPTMELPDVSPIERDELAQIRDEHRARLEHRFAFLTVLVGKGRTTPLYGRTVPPQVKAARRQSGKAQRIARALHRKAAR